MKRKLPEYLSNPNSDTVIVFIHGLGGGYTTWKKFANILHEEWKENDAFSLKYDHYYNNTVEIPVYSFFTKSFFGDNIETLSRHLDSVIRSLCKYYENIILICHSMGGLIARKYIIDLLNKERDLGKIKALITYATPHLGSSLANVCKTIFWAPAYIFKFASLRLISQIKDLSKNSKIITSINADWTKLGVNQKLDFIRIFGYADYVVGIDSAKLQEEDEDDDNVFGFANKDHFNIIKPTTNFQDSALYVTYNYLKEFNRKIESENEFEDEEYSEDSDMDY
ncbi:hypothetical protein HMPREF9713_01736 [Myroides odoratimimus CCUG 12700]|uniref:esterase/lipase family protein n=1 Tax=Myroides odoratimimus TaxID=76832 RepID=UPI000353313A|nr:alpha/beta hydrolase [Myroides odoratimimus]EPH11251.1 hypothetical protein HMPREF9713_01736 [Myroides odoratimimus CCUG 12700]